MLDSVFCSGCKTHCLVHWSKKILRDPQMRQQVLHPLIGTVALVVKDGHTCCQEWLYQVPRKNTCFWVVAVGLKPTVGSVGPKDTQGSANETTGFTPVVRNGYIRCQRWSITPLHHSSTKHAHCVQIGHRDSDRSTRLFYHG